MGVKILIDKIKVANRVHNAWKASLPKTSEEILEDCNRYAKYQDGTLIQSSQEHSRLDKGLLIWQTPYAKRQYWEIPTAHTDKNPLANWMWCEVAKQRHENEWNEKAQKEFTDHL